MIGDSEKCEQNIKLKSNKSNKFSIENILGLNEVKEPSKSDLSDDGVLKIFVIN